MGRKVKVIKDTTLIPVDVSSKSEVKPATGYQSADNFLNAKIDNESKRAQEKENFLQQQIDELSEKGYSVKDVVYTYANLMEYDTRHLINKDIIVVMNDEHMGGGVSSFYRWDGTRFYSLGSSSYTVAQIDMLIADLNDKIAYLEQKSSVRDVVLSYNDLQAYDVRGLIEGDIVAVLEDSTHNTASTYYRLNSSKVFEFVGGLGPNYYTKDELNSKFAQIQAVLDDHEIRITDNREDIDNRISEEDALDTLRGE